MANYKSIYTGAEIDSAIGKANTAIQDVSDKQDTLVSGTNIKTINGNSILGEGNLVIEGGEGFLTEETISSGGDVAVTGLELDLYTYNAIVGGSFYINPIVLPTNATDKAVSWSSSDNTIATVNEQGQVNAIATGTSNIICTTHDGGFTATCVVTVSEGTIVPVDSVSLNKATTSLQVGNTETLTATVLPANATDKTLTWSTSDNMVATVNSGTVNAIASGTVTITATSNADNTKYDSCVVTIVAPPTPTQKIQFSTLQRTSGCIKTDGTSYDLGKTYNIEIPYTEGMQIKTTWKNGWMSGYAPFIVKNGSTYTVPEFEWEKDGQGNIPNHTVGNANFANYASTILTEQPSGSTVIVNMYCGSATAQEMDETDNLYYVEGGSE